MKINECIIKYHEQNRYTKIFDEEGLLGKREHIKNIIEIAEKIADIWKSDVDRKFLAICAEHHDDGRVDQYHILGKFWDSKISHNELGIERFNKFLKTQKDFKEDTSVKIFKDVILYHGITDLDKISPESRKYVEIVGAADHFENACSCVSYLVKEVETDAKGYIYEHPDADQTFVSDFVFQHFKDGEIFDKRTYCTTYAEYVLYAATLATSSIKKYGDIAKKALLQPGYGYETILLGFKDVFGKTLSEKKARTAFEILSSMCK